MATSRESASKAQAKVELTSVDGLAQLSFLVQTTLERRAAEHDLSMIQTRLLGVLRDRTPSMNELARLLDLDKSSVTGLVSRAQQRGLVTRVPSSADRRAVQVNLTTRGRSLVGKVSTAFASDVAGLLAHLAPAERKALSGLVSRMLVAHAASNGIDLFANTTKA